MNKIYLFKALISAIEMGYLKRFYSAKGMMLHVENFLRNVEDKKDGRLYLHRRGYPYEATLSEVISSFLYSTKYWQNTTSWR